MIFGQGGILSKCFRRISWLWYKPAWTKSQGIWLPCNQPGITLRIAQQIYFGNYETREIEIVAQKLEASDTVIELGAGLGYMSAFCAKRIGSDRVHAFEANPALIPLIQATHERNSVRPKVHHALLGRGEGERTFHVEPDFWISSTRARSPRAQAIKVPQRDINVELKRLAPTFLIIDIEGDEGELFAYADLAVIRKICVETHPEVLCDDEISTILTSLLRQGFVLDMNCSQINVFYFYRTK